MIVGVNVMVKCPNCLKEKTELKKRKWFRDYYLCLDCKYDWEVS